MHTRLGLVTSHSALHDPLHPTTTSPPVQLAETSQLALAAQVASQLACTFRLAWQSKLTVRAIDTPFMRSAWMYAFKTPHASLAVVLVVSSPRSALISLQTVSH